MKDEKGLQFYLLLKRGGTVIEGWTWTDEITSIVKIYRSMDKNIQLTINEMKLKICNNEPVLSASSCAAYYGCEGRTTWVIMMISIMASWSAPVLVLFNLVTEWSVLLWLATMS